MKPFHKLLLTCEHATPHIPPSWLNPASPALKAALKTHAGWDIGALTVAKILAKLTQAPLLQGEVSRLLIDLNRSSNHPTLISPLWQSKITDKIRQGLITKYHQPFRERTLKTFERFQGPGPIFHLSVHSFTPIWDNHPRKTDIGILFDPKRPLESSLAHAWQNAMKRSKFFESMSSDLRPKNIHRNRPYRGTDNAHVTEWREEFSAKDYLGLEIEVNNRLILSPPQAQIMGLWLYLTLESALIQLC